MCEDCETESLYVTYAQKRARIAAYWRPARYNAYVARAIEPELPPAVAGTGALNEKRTQP